MRNAGTAFALLICGGFITTIVVMQWYPAAIMKASPQNGGQAHIVWEFQIQKVANSALMYYKNALKNDPLRQSSPPRLGEAGSEARTSTLIVTAEMEQDAYQKSRETILENLIVNDAIQQQGLMSVAEARIAKKIAEYTVQPDFSIAVSLVYGLDNSGFVELMARPEAEQELLKEKNKWDDAALAVWIAEEKKQSRIVRFFK